MVIGCEIVTACHNDDQPEEGPSGAFFVIVKSWDGLRFKL